MNAMKIMFFIPLCLMISLAKGDPIAEQLCSVRSKVSALPGDLTLENINSVIEQINELVESSGEMTEDEESEIMELSEESMFLSLLKNHIENPSQETSKGLEEWIQCKPDLSVYTRR